MPSPHSILYMHAHRQGQGGSTKRKGEGTLRPQRELCRGGLGWGQKGPRRLLGKGAGGRVEVYRVSGLGEGDCIWRREIVGTL